MLAFLLDFTPNLPGLIYAVAGSTGQHSVHISAGARHLYTFDWVFGFVTGAFVYAVASLLFPEAEAMVDQTITSRELIDSRPGTETEDEKALENIKVDIAPDNQ